MNRRRFVASFVAALALPRARPQAQPAAFLRRNGKTRLTGEILAWRIEYVEARSFTLAEIARMFRVPPELLTPHEGP